MLNFIRPVLTYVDMAGKHIICRRCVFFFIDVLNPLLIMYISWILLYRECDELCVQSSLFTNDQITSIG